MKQKIVIKLGGSALQNPETLKELATLIRGLRKKRYNVVVVHGGGPAINQALKQRGIEWKFIDGQRQTTAAMMEVIDEVLSKDVNSTLVTELRNAKIAAVGLSGANGILFCTQSNPELMQVGKVEKVNPSTIEACFSGFPRPTPVIAPIGFGSGNSQGVEKFNVNADWAATQIAIAIGAKKLIFLTDQNGILDQEHVVIKKASPRNLENMIEAGVISGGMCTKVRAMMTALSAGIRQVRVLHASQASQLLLDEKIGTLLTETPLQKDLMHGRAS